MLCLYFSQRKKYIQEEKEFFLFLLQIRAKNVNVLRIVWAAGTTNGLRDFLDICEAHGFFLGESVIYS